MLYFSRCGTDILSRTGRARSPLARLSKPSGRVAQLAEHSALNRQVVGSIPTASTNSTNTSAAGLPSLRSGRDFACGLRRPQNGSSSIPTASTNSTNNFWLAGPSPALRSGGISPRAQTPAKGSSSIPTVPPFPQTTSARESFLSLGFKVGSSRGLETPAKLAPVFIPCSARQQSSELDSRSACALFPWNASYATLLFAVVHSGIPQAHQNAQLSIRESCPSSHRR